MITSLLTSNQLQPDLLRGIHFFDFKRSENQEPFIIHDGKEEKKYLLPLNEYLAYIAFKLKQPSQTKEGLTINPDIPSYSEIFSRLVTCQLYTPDSYSDPCPIAKFSSSATSSNRYSELLFLSSFLSSLKPPLLKSLQE